MEDPQKWKTLEQLSRNEKCAVFAVEVDGEKYIAKQYYKRPLKRECTKRAQKTGVQCNEIDVIRDEYDLMKETAHPRIIQVHALVDKGTSVYLLSEFGGHSLGIDDIKDDRRYPIQDVLIWMVQMTQGIKHLHDKGIVHGDIKSSNILLLPNGDIKICDLGSAIRNVSDNQPIKKLPKGTPAFNSPELCKVSSQMGNQQIPIYGKPLDIWALGVTVYRLLYGKMPFDCTGTIFQLQEAIMNYPIDIPNEVLMQDGTLTSIPVKFKELLLALLDKDPRTRMTIDELSLSLQGV